ncbi:antitoxin Xre-like helix-turn-helix domain-containing protein [Deinococcus depolymerans]
MMIDSPSQLIDKITHGLPFSAMENLQKALSVSNSELLKITHMSRTTYNRRKEMGELSLGESNIIFRYAQIYALALRVFEDPKLVDSWLTSELDVFSGKTPLEYSVTEPGAAYVNNVLINLDQGNFMA